MKEGGRNRPIDADGGVHSCEEMKKSMKTIKSIPASEIDPELLKQYETAINNKAQKK